MTAPRQILPGTTYLVTRRCSQRQFLLRPSAITNQIFAYVLALAARRFGVCVHAYCVLSNHFHLVVTDPQAQLPGFSQYLDGLVARACGFRPKPIADSGASRSLIPVEADHRFRSKPIAERIVR